MQYSAALVTMVIELAFQLFIDVLFVFACKTNGPAYH